MKKKATMVDQPCKTDASRSELTNPLPVKKMYRDHSVCDHSHGRVNKYPFGSSHGPMPF